MFALTNVLLRRFQGIPAQARMLAMFAGCMSMGLLAALTASSLGVVPGFPAFDSSWAFLALGLAVVFDVWQLGSAIWRSASALGRDLGGHAQRSGVCQRLLRADRP